MNVEQRLQFDIRGVISTRTGSKCVTLL